MAKYIITTTLKAETEHPRKSFPDPRIEIQTLLKRAHI